MVWQGAIERKDEFGMVVNNLTNKLICKYLYKLLGKFFNFSLKSNNPIWDKSRFFPPSLRCMDAPSPWGFPLHSFSHQIFIPVKQGSPSLS